MKNRFLFCAFFLWQIYFYSCSQYQRNNVDFNHVLIHYVHSGIVTFISVSSEGFESYFGDTYKKIDITDSAFIIKLKQCLTNERIARKINVDVRTKIYLYKDEKLMAVYGMDREGCLILNNEKNVKNSCFVDIINIEVENDSR